MPDDLVARLRARTTQTLIPGRGGDQHPLNWRVEVINLLREAADEIERLRGADTHERITAEERDGLLAERQTLRAELERLTKRLAKEERECEKLIDVRDRREEQIQEIHLALGGDGEWTSCVDLGDDCHELIAVRDAERDALVARVADLTEALRDPICGACEGAGGRSDGRDWFVCQSCAGTLVSGKVRAALSPAPTRE